jgi:hypothetical protein
VIFLASCQSELVSNSREELYVNLMFKNSSQSHSVQSQAFTPPDYPKVKASVQFMPFTFTVSLPPITETHSVFGFGCCAPLFIEFFRRKGRKKERRKYSSNGSNY